MEEAKYYINAILVWTLSYLTSLDLANVVIQILTTVCAIIATVIAVRKYFDSREAHRAKMRLTQMQEDALAQQYLYYNKKNLVNPEKDETKS